MFSLRKTDEFKRSRKFIHLKRKVKRTFDCAMGSCGSFLFFFLLLTVMVGTYGGLNILCLLEHCGGKTLECMENTDCKQNFECITACNSNATCIFVCLNTYENTAYDDLMQCSVFNHHCLAIDPPDPSFRCSPPKTFVRNFTLNQLAGTWYLIRGINKEYDCFDCHIANYAPSTVPKNYTLSDRFDLSMINGTIRHRLSLQQIQQKNPDNGGLLDNTNLMMGLSSYEKWQVVHYSDDGKFVVMYWCGHVTSDWWYEGMFVYSRSPTLASRELTALAEILKSTTGHTLDEFCSPKTIDCRS